MIEEYDKFNNLIHIYRWSGKRVLIQESDSDHVWGMNSLAIDFVSRLPEGYDKREILKQLIYRITLHDLGEAFYTDIPRPFKYKTKELAKLIHDTEDILIDENLSPEIAEDTKNAKSRDPEDPIGFLVSVFDAVQAGLKMKEEINLGNQLFKTEIANSTRLLDYYRQIISDYKAPNQMLSIIKEYITECIISLNNQ